MNCFEWQNRSSDYLDGTLIGSTKQEADEHLETCNSCSERHAHYRMIVGVLSNRPRAALPMPIRKAPLTAGLPRLEITTSRWAAIPWYLRTGIEAVAIILVTLAGISLGPKARTLYENKIEKSLSDFSQPFGDIPKSDAPPPIAANAPTDAAAPAAEDFSSSEGDSEDSGDSEDTNAGEETIRVGKSDVWRFILKTDSPGELRTKVVEVLTQVRPENDKQSVEGIRAPGGIQFDLLLPQTAVQKIKTELSGLAPPAPDGLADTPAGETFTWYKVKSKRKIPDGKTRVVIWISQM